MSCLRHSAPVLFAKSRCLPRVLPAVAAVLVAQLLLADSTYTVLFSDFEMRAAAAPLLPSGWGVLVGFAMLRQQPELERRLARLTWSRLAWAAVLAVSCVVLTVPLALVSAQPGLLVLRNAVLMTGLGMATAVVLGATRAWILPVFTTSVCYFAGRLYEGEDPHWWALPLHPQDSPAAAAVALGVLIAGVGLYAVADSRSTAGLPPAWD